MVAQWVRNACRRLTRMVDSAFKVSGLKHPDSVEECEAATSLDGPKWIRESPGFHKSVPNGGGARQPLAATIIVAHVASLFHHGNPEGPFFRSRAYTWEARYIKSALN